jgi:hypothetical protein
MELIIGIIIGIVLCYANHKIDIIKKIKEIIKNK